MAELSLGLGRVLIFRKDADAAIERFEKVLERHPAGDHAAEATYWLGVAEYKASHDPERLRARWARLAREFPASSWARRTELDGSPRRRTPGN